MAKPINFLTAVSKDEAERVWHAALSLDPLGVEEVPLEAAHGRVLAEAVTVPRDVPPFDRSLVDGYALRAADTFAAEEEAPARLKLGSERIPAGRPPRAEVTAGLAVEIATGGVIPRGANAVQMVERTDVEAGDVLVYKPVVPGAHIQHAGADMRAGEVVLRAGERLSSRETGVLAALGIASARVWRRPLVAVLSTGDELRAPGSALDPGSIYDSNSRVIADALAENGCEARFHGIVPDVEERLAGALREALDADAVIVSGGTSKGAGDLSFRLIGELSSPGVLVHGVNLKPGKPIVLAAWGTKPVVVLPGFPTSAIITFNVLVRPVLRRLAGLPPHEPAQERRARLASRLHSAPGRHELALVHLAERGTGLVAYPIGQASGSVSAFAKADGYIEVGADTDLVREGEDVRVALFARTLEPPSLVFIGSHCQGVDLALGLGRGSHGLTAKIINAGSTAGIAACAADECDFAGVHLLDPRTGRYNRDALRQAGPGAVLVRGYRRQQGLYYRSEEFAGGAPGLAELVDREGSRLMNRNRGAGTRVLLDRLLAELASERGRKPDELVADLAGYDVEARSHNAVAAAVAAGRADWGVGIESVASGYGLGFVPLREEEYDFLVPRSRLDRGPVAAFRAVLRSDAFGAALAALPGFTATPDIGEVIAHNDTGGHPHA